MNHITKTIGNSNKNTEIQQRIIGMHKKNIENPPLLPVSEAPNVMKISLNPPQTIRNGPWNNDNSDFCGTKMFCNTFNVKSLFFMSRRPDSEPKIART